MPSRSCTRGATLVLVTLLPSLPVLAQGTGIFPEWGGGARLDSSELDEGRVFVYTDFPTRLWLDSAGDVHVQGVTRVPADGLGGQSRTVRYDPAGNELDRPATPPIGGPRQRVRDDDPLLA